MCPAKFMKIKEGFWSHDPALGGAVESPGHIHDPSCRIITIFIRCDVCAQCDEFGEFGGCLDHQTCASCQRNIPSLQKQLGLHTHNARVLIRLPLGWESSSAKSVMKVFLDHLLQRRLTYHIFTHSLRVKIQISILFPSTRKSFTSSELPPFSLRPET